MDDGIRKIAVVDDRIVQGRPKYGVALGSASVASQTFQAMTFNTSQLTYNIICPDVNTFIDRKLLMSARISGTFVVTASTVAVAGAAIVQPGRDVALAAMPLNSCFSTVSATFNNQTLTANLGLMLYELLRMSDYKEDRLMRTTPTMLDRWASYTAAGASINSPISGYNNQTAEDEVPNGAYPGFWFTDADGNRLTNGQTVGAAPNQYISANGLPSFIAAQAPPYTIYWQAQLSEPLILSPYVYSDSQEWGTGLFGVTNMQITCNFDATRISRLIRFSGFNNGFAMGSVALTSVTNAVVSMQFLTPSLSVPLPIKSVIPIFDPQPQPTTYAITIAAGATSTITSNVFQLNTVPDLILLYLKPATYADNSNADWYLPLAGKLQGVNSPLNLIFNNQTGLLSSCPTETLYDNSVRNGLKMTWQEWSGQTTMVNSAAAQPTQTVGGPVVIRPGIDFSLVPGVAPGSNGNWSFQVTQMQVYNPSAAPVTNVTLYCLFMYSGFLESQAGTSTKLVGILNERDVVDAPKADMITRQQLVRKVGGGFFDRLSTGIHKAIDLGKKAHDIYEKTKPFVSAAKGHLPEGARGVAEKLGYGTGGALGRRRHHAPLEERL